MVAALVYWIATPRTFRATATVRVWKTGAGQTNHPTALYDPNTTLPGECEVIRSQAVLDPVIKSLHLDERWRGGSNQGAAGDSASGRLRMMLAAKPAINAGIIRVSVTGDDPRDVAAIANEVVRSYCAYRARERAALSHETVGQFGAEAAELNAQMLRAQSNLVLLAQRYNFELATRSSNFLTAEQYQAAQSDRDRVKRELDQQASQLERMKPTDTGSLVEAVARWEGATNTALPGALRQLQQARDRLAAAQSNGLADSDSVRQAQAAVQELQAIAENSARGIAAAQQTQVASLRAEFEVLDRRLSSVSTNTAELTGEHPEYRQAVQDLESLRTRKAALEERIKAEDSAEAVVPVSLAAEVVDDAVLNMTPATPKLQPALALAVMGLVISLAGLYLKLGKTGRASPAPPKPRSN